MSRLLIAAFIAVLLFGSIPVACWQIRRARREESVRDRLVRLAHERAERASVQDSGVLDPGPVEQQAAVALTSYVLDNLYLADGFARLDQAIRDHSNTPEGD